VTVRFDFQGEIVAPRDAATVLVLRDSNNGPEIFFVRRNADVRFMGGAYVFPGGRVDVGDSDTHIRCDLTPQEAAERLGDDNPSRALALHVAALRECLEEAGILLATTPVEGATIATLRMALSQREASPFSTLLARHNLTLSPRSLRVFSRWVTPRAEARRFDTRFFLARANAQSSEAVHDGGETVASVWLTARAAIERCLRGEIILAPPTWRTLDSICHASNVEEVMSMSCEAPVAIEPMVEILGDTPCVVLPEGAHAGGNSMFANRFIYRDGAWFPLEHV
jgi:8-oxo-dGTP pyrophosphatase MutT (NUDIX family)